MKRLYREETGSGIRISGFQIQCGMELSEGLCFIHLLTIIRQRLFKKESFKHQKQFNYTQCLFQTILNTQSVIT